MLDKFNGLIQTVLSLIQTHPRFAIAGGVLLFVLIFCFTGASWKSKALVIVLAVFGVGIMLLRYVNAIG